MSLPITLLRRWTWHRGRFAAQLAGCLLLMSTLPVLVYYLVFSTKAEQTIVDLAARQSLQALRNQRDYLQLQLDQIESLAANLSQVDEIASTLARLNRHSTETSYDVLATKARVGYLLSNYRNLGGLVSIDIFTLSDHHFHVGDTLVDPDERAAQRDSLWDRTIRSTSVVTWHGVEDNVQKYSSSQKVLTASKLLMSASSSWLKAEPVAMLLISYSTDHMHEHLSSISQGDGAYLLVLDDQRRLIYHPDKRLIGQHASADFAALLDGPSGAHIQRLGDDDVLLSYVRIDDKNWYVASVIPRQTLLAPMANLQRVALAMLAGMLVLVLIFLRLVTSRVIGPVSDIAEGFRKFQLSRLAPGWRLKVPGSLASVQDLTHWFNTFLDTMERRQESDTRLRIAATAFESRDGMFVTDAQLVMLQVNHALCRITGHGAEALIGRTPDLLVDAPQAGELLAEMRRVLGQTGAWQGELLNRRSSGEPYPAWLAINAVRNEQQQITHYVATLADITLRKASEEEIRQLAFYDPLTGLPNRRLLTDRLQQAMLTCVRRRHTAALMFMDLDKFKTLNDTLGHDAGDALLKQVAQRLLACVREVDTVARLGGDEFVVLVEGLSASSAEAAAQAETVALKILRSLHGSYAGLGGLDYDCTASLGITLIADAGNRIDELMKQADIALYQAKEAGRNTHRFFDPAMQAHVMERAALESSIRQGLQRHEFQPYYQIKVGVDGRPVGAEVLVRWQHPQRGIVLPGDFIAVAEETGLIVQLGHQILRAACQQLSHWAGQDGLGRLDISVNVSPREFRQPDFVAQVFEALDQTGADPARLTLEITESLLVENVEETVDKMVQLQRRGISLALDDFGTGYSSLTYLKRMPLRELKIDQSFVQDVMDDANAATIARAVISLSRELGLQVVAEGVETCQQFAFLKASGCQLFQGHLFGPALPVADFERLLDGMAADQQAA